jgi:6-phospho-beta-glucosidase
MKITIIGAAGVRTPLIVQAMARRQSAGRLPLDELALMDIDADRLDLIGALTAPLEQHAGFRLTRTTDARAALRSADYVITTFRVGGIESRVVDERVPLSHGVLGQETTGPGGFAMALRTIPVLLDYIALMRDLCPDAWLINFANPAGLLTEAIVRVAEWTRAVGICDSPRNLLVAATALGLPPDQVYLDYFGLNHLGWARAVIYGNRDILPQFIEWLRHSGQAAPDLPFDSEFIAALGLLPNEYLYYYYHADQAVQNMLDAGRSRGEQIAALNGQLFDRLGRLKARGEAAGMLEAYRAYLGERGGTYMAAETGRGHAQGSVHESGGDEGYAGVALDLIEALSGTHARTMILNVPNGGALNAMAAEDVVEIPAAVARDSIRPLAVGDVPDHCLGLIKQVKAYERLTLDAAVTGSYARALAALTLHPLVRDHARAKAILDGYRQAHGAIWPVLR